MMYPNGNIDKSQSGKTGHRPYRVREWAGLLVAVTGLAKVVLEASKFIAGLLT